MMAHNYNEALQGNNNALRGILGSIDELPTAPAITGRTYDITLAAATRWSLLTELDDDVLAHINDPGLVVTLSNMDGFAYEYYSASLYIASNTSFGMQGQYPVYGMMLRQPGETSTSWERAYYPANKTDTGTSLGFAPFRVDGTKYYASAKDGYIRSGDYRLTFTW